MKCKKEIFGILFFLSFGAVQSNAQQATTFAGGDASGSGGTVAFAFGQALYTTSSGVGGTVSQGVEQVYEIILLGSKETEPEFMMSVYPNPTTNNLTLEVQSYSNKKMEYVLFDLNGRMLDNQNIIESHTQINTSAYPPATYFLKIIYENKMVQTFKFIKQ